MKIKRQLDVEIDVTLEDLADLFADLDGRQQAWFFILVAQRFRGFALEEEIAALGRKQLLWIAEHLAKEDTSGYAREWIEDLAGFLEES